MEVQRTRISQNGGVSADTSVPSESGFSAPIRRHGLLPAPRPAPTESAVMPPKPPRYPAPSPPPVCAAVSAGIRPHQGQSSVLSGLSGPRSIRPTLPQCPATPGHRHAATIQRRKQTLALARWQNYSSADMDLLQAIFWSTGVSRHALAGRLAYSKSKANAMVAALLDEGVLDEVGLQESSGGRRAETLRLSESLGAVLGVDMDATSMQLALMRPDMAVLARQCETIDVRRGPGVILAQLCGLMRELMARCGLSSSQLIAIGMGVPGPVDFASGQLVNPPLMPDWDGFSIRDYLREAFVAPVFVDNDVNLMALGKLWRLQRKLSDFLVIKVGTGIGCGIVCHGQVYRGTNGSAGGVGRICGDQAGPRCHGGNQGWVEARAAAPALVRAAIEVAQKGESSWLAERLQASGSLGIEGLAQASRVGGGGGDGGQGQRGYRGPGAGQPRGGCGGEHPHPARRQSGRADAGFGGEFFQSLACIHWRAGGRNGGAVSGIGAPERVPPLAGAFHPAPGNTVRAAGR